MPVEDESYKARFVEEFNPDKYKIDRRLLYEITGLRMRQDELTELVSELSENSDSDGEVGRKDLQEALLSVNH